MDISKIKDTVGGTGRLQSITDRLAEQQKNIDQLMTPTGGLRAPSLPPIPKNPIWETNDRLARIEKQFEAMQGIASESAQIATALQAYAAEFLSKFEAAAESTDASARKAVRLSFLAIVFTVATTLMPFVYQLWRAPVDAAEERAIVEQLQSELSGLRESQMQMATQIEDALGTNGQSTVEALQEIQKILRETSATAAPAALP